jgi:prepilin-type N-terminal cleavage/methylation domain-containing protein
MRRPSAYTLAELLIVVAILSALAVVAVPRLQFAAVRQRKAEAAALDLASALRRTRSLAILYAATNTAGYRLQLTKAGQTTSYQIVNLGDSSTVDSRTLDSAVTTAGGQSFQFTSLGALKAGSDSSLTVSADGRTCTITVVSATGMVKSSTS